jgi:hypothetical protein
MREARPVKKNKGRFESEYCCAPSESGTRPIISDLQVMSSPEGQP